MDKGSTIISYIERAKSLVYDSNTFLKVRIERPFYIGDGIGGGNLLIALGLFSSLGYLAKIYVLLKGECILPTPEDIQKATESYKSLEKKVRKNLLFIKRLDSINETDAFRKFLSDPQCPQNLGIEEDDYAKIYHEIRDHLAHRVSPDQGHTMVTFQTDENQELPYADVKKTIMESRKPVFERTNDTLICYVDILARDVETIADWLISEVKSSKFKEENLEITLNWLS